MTDTPTTAPRLEEQIAWLQFACSLRCDSIEAKAALPYLLAILASLERLRDIDRRAPASPSQGERT